jgi:tripartite-type tricarboxylate transporter receptor subunit TctC
MAPGNTTTRRAVLAGALAAAVLAAAGTAPAAAQSYPERPIRMIVPFAPGGGGDTLGRLYAAGLEKVLGRQVVVDNKPGAGGNIGSAEAARAEPDGYTILFGTNGTFGINHALYRDTGFDPRADFEPVARLTRIGMVLAVNPEKLPQAGVPELVAHMKANPGKVTFASAGNGTSSHIAGEMFKMMTGADMLHVPFRGNGPAMVDLIAGRVDMIIDVMPSAYPHVEAGRLRALAVTTKDPVAAAPDLPTLDASGVPGFEMSAWDGLWVPDGTPEPVVRRLNEAVQQVLRDPEIARRLAARGAEPVFGGPQLLGDLVAAELPKWAEVVQRSGARID